MNNWKAVLLDIIIVLVITGLGGFVVAVEAFRDHVMSPTALEISNLLFGTIGFTLSGCKTKVDRFKHLSKVAIGVWIFSMVNVIFLGYTLRQWIFGLPFLLVMMGLGGFISLLFVKTPALKN